MVSAVAIVIGASVAALGGMIVTRPKNFHVQRTTRIKAAPERISPFIADFNKWAAWSPFEKLDPHMKRTLTGSPSGVGAVYEWDGNSKAGKGRMEILEVAPQKVVIDLQFTRPFKAKNTAEFTFVPAGNSTDVTWATYGPNRIVGKVMGIFVDMDKLIGKGFEQGLSSLKSVAEGS